MKIRYILFVLICSVVCISFAGCGNKKQNTSDNPDSVSDDNGSDEDEDNNALHEGGKKSLEIYTIDHGQGCIPSVSLIDSDVVVDANLIIEEVIANYDEKVIIYKTEENDDNVVVYFEDDSAPLINVTAVTEEAMLDCIAYSLLDNLDFCQKVYYRCRSGKYQSDNMVIESDEPYVTR